ncbi:unnamed protein product [Porites evermanni]|uniref:50S ribosomal protein L35 n=1 Tax=Porites evermanni TaxID=104178 RepID=A0ABN8QIV7_9CNID|nr:unnamed protein product [Porites evermanni]
MAARVCSVSRGVFSFPALPSLRTICSLFRRQGLEFHNKITKLPSHNFQTSRFSTFDVQASAMRSCAHSMKFQLAGQPLKFQSVYPFDSAPRFMKQIEQMSQKSCFTIIRRSINTKSKLGKRKTCKAVAARFLRTGKGKLKRWRTGKSHKMMHKGPKRSRHLRKPTYVNKQQLKLLNKMLNGW